MGTIAKETIFDLTRLSSAGHMAGYVGDAITGAGPYAEQGHRLRLCAEGL